MTTSRELITGALRLINAVQANEEPSAEDMDISRESLNALIDSKSNDLLNIHTITPYRFLLTPGQFKYSLGPDGTWSIPRPMRIEQAKVMLNPIVSDQLVITSDTNTLFLPFKMLNDEQFADIRQRGLNNNWPTVFFDNGGYPLRDVYVWPVPTTRQAVELWLWEPLRIYDLDTELDLPQGYERYLRFKLAVEVAAEFGKDISQAVMDLSIEAEKNLKSLNQQVPIAKTTGVFSRKPTQNYITFTGGLDVLPDF